MKSIKKDIVRAVTIIPAVILFSLFLTIDFFLDDWVEDKFDETLTTKSNYLKSLVKVTDEGVKFDFAGEFMPEFERKHNAEYFELWVDNKPFERSDSLIDYPEEQLARKPIDIGISEIIDITLPDGRSGRAIMSHFYPQVPSHLRGSALVNAHTVFFTVSTSNESFSRVLIVLDIVFWLVFFTLILGIRYLVIAQINKGLKPLILLNEEIANLKVDETTSSLKTVTDEHIEIAPIRSEISRFIEFSQHSLKEEQRLSADIAHELKTPISEIISLSELNIQYPNDKRISDSYSEDMLSIALRMKNIVNNLMMINHSDHDVLKKHNKTIDLTTTINKIIESIQSTSESTFERVKLNSLAEHNVNLDIVSFNIILSNLLSNAYFYSPADSSIELTIEKNQKGSIQIVMANTLSNPMTEKQLSMLFNPLYQVDASRTDTSRYGLGLAIVNKLCKINNYSITAHLLEENKIKFILVLNKR